MFASLKCLAALGNKASLHPRNEGKRAYTRSVNKHFLETCEPIHTATIRDYSLCPILCRKLIIENGHSWPRCCGRQRVDHFFHSSFNPFRNSTKSRNSRFVSLLVRSSGMADFVVRRSSMSLFFTVTSLPSAVISRTSFSSSPL